MQCDQMARLVFKNWPFTAMEIYPKVEKFRQIFSQCYDAKPLHFKLFDNLKVEKFNVSSRLNF